MDIGLECYISEHSGFCGQLKKFCEDFLVTEIDESGCLVELTSQEIQSDKHVDKCHSKVTAETTKHDNRLVTSERCSNAETDNTDKDGSLLPTNKYFYKLADITSPDAIQEAFDELTRLVGEMKVLELKDMYTKMQTDAKTIILGCFNSKSDRINVHLNARMAFPGIKTETVNQNGVYSITANIDQVFLDFLALFNDKVTVENLMRFCCCIDKNTPASVDLPFCTDKDKRTKIHRSLAKHFGSFLESKTFVSEKQDINKKSCIQIRMRQKKGSSRKGNTQRIAENKQSKNHRGKGEIYTRFVLKKENMETLEAIERLSRALGTHSSSFSFAGIKDKKAVTLQNVVVKAITPEQLSAVINKASLSNMLLGNYRREKRPLEKGQHGGNAFRIVIRDVHLNLQEQKDIRCKDAIDENVKEAVANVKKYGFINYFGRQRFGQDDSTRADEIGLAMLQGNMVQAINLLLRPSNKKDDTNDAKRYFQETGDVPGTLSRMPQDRTRECLILKSLHRHGQDLDGCTKAFLNIPYSMRLLYAHSYVSLLWNKMASYRINEYGLSNIVEGDLVHDPSSRGFHTSQSTSVGSATTPSEDDQDNTDMHSMRDIDERAKNLQTDEDNEKIHKDGPHNIATSIVKSQIKVVTEEDVRAARYTIRDLVLPIPGYNVIYPTNRLGHRYQEALEKDGLGSKRFRIRSLAMTLPGAYRKVIAVPLDLDFRWISIDDTKQVAGFSPGNTYPLKTNQTHTSYDLPDKCCVNSGKIESYSKRERDGTYVSNVYEADDLEGHEPCRKRLKHDDGETSSNYIENNMEISFKLQPSCYATVCLREIMKT